MERCKIGGDWYQIDVTWNDTDGENNYAENDYFNLTDDLMFKDHKLSYKYSELNSQTYLSVATWCNFYVPKCTAEKYNYFNYKYPTVSDPDNADDVSQAIANAAKTEMNISALLLIRIPISIICMTGL